MRCMLLPMLLIVWAGTAHAQDLDARLDRLEQLTYRGTPTEIQQRIESMEPALAGASTSRKARFTLLKARAAGVARRNQEAMRLVEELLARRERLSPETELRALTLAANLLIVSNRFAAGFDYYRESLELAPGVKAPVARANTWNVAAGFHTRIGEHATAVEYANRAMAEVERPASPRTHCIALERRARARLAMDEADAAIGDYRDAIELCESVPDIVFAGMARVGLARALRAGGDSQAVQPLLDRAIEQLGRSGFREGELEARMLMAEIMLDRGLAEEARTTLAPALAWLEDDGNAAVRAGIMDLRARLAAAAGDQAAVYEHTRQAIEFERQHAARVRQMRLSMLMSAHDDDARQAEVELLRSRNALAELDREASREQELALTYGGFGVVAAGVLLSGLLIRTARERRRLQRLSERDALTGLFNHTRFFELAQQAFQRARQNAVGFALIVADIDLFKQVNDEFGHLVGDSVLARVGARLRAAFGPDAIIGRLGGEEFGVALPDCDIDSAVARIEHLRATLNRQRIDDAEPAITMSFGVAELGREPTLDVLYAHADQALYDAKDAGRNRVITVARIDLGGTGILT